MISVNKGVHNFGLQAAGDDSRVLCFILTKWVVCAAVVKSMARRWGLSRKGLEAEAEMAEILKTARLGAKEKDRAHVDHSGVWTATQIAAWYNLYVDCGLLEANKMKLHY